MSHASARVGLGLGMVPVSCTSIFSGVSNPFPMSTCWGFCVPFSVPDCVRCLCPFFSLVQVNFVACLRSEFLIKQLFVSVTAAVLPFQVFCIRWLLWTCVPGSNLPAYIPSISSGFMWISVVFPVVPNCASLIVWPRWFFSFLCCLGRKSSFPSDILLCAILVVLGLLMVFGLLP